VWNGREQMNEVQNWEAWCMRITKNLSLDRIRSLTRKQTQPIEDGIMFSRKIYRLMSQPKFRKA